MALIRREVALAAIDAVGAHSSSTLIVKAKCYAVVKTDSVVPTVDAVEVVRCRDCRYWRQEVDPHTHWVCTQHSFNERMMHTTPDFFCAGGLRRDDNVDGKAR